ncbi:Lipopolysaccharide export system ATP-binding protein LptB [Roseivivax sp. THAF40]|uniref:ABC transporter ATP-binding protein n=1 Tax=unclassified Roseivivax TaxID=2639302 RepID=UPI0012688A3A|nr:MULTISPECIES: ABC transporter ATP-binding protein [unclassified Roseivivax]QFS84144.1 Lipopolysaccharide export system ATP-binding protein LptB [Roseivivax sp. THAF197b]QFT47972.1 Lipopolysaccharide export system ATP-binding protein LptB [Roseivivax sp. THAF40]
MSALLSVEGLSRHYGALRAVDEVSFTLAPGDIRALIGPNGAGKSTLFKMLMGETRPTSGSVTFEGRRITGLSPAQICRRGVGRTFQITGTWPSMTVLENVQTARLSARRRSFAVLPFARSLEVEASRDLLANVGMSDQADRPAAVLAYGDLKRLELAIALAHTPKLLLMDEPTAGMAATERADLMETVTGIARDRGMTILFTEHDMDVVFEHARTVMVLDRGQLIAHDTPDAVRADPRVQEVYLGAGLDPEALDDA